MNLGLVIKSLRHYKTFLSHILHSSLSLLTHAVHSTSQHRVSPAHTRNEHRLTEHQRGGRRKVNFQSHSTDRVEAAADILSSPQPPGVCLLCYRSLLSIPSSSITSSLSLPHVLPALEEHHRYTED